MKSASVLFNRTRWVFVIESTREMSGLRKEEVGDSGGDVGDDTCDGGDDGASCSNCWCCDVLDIGEEEGEL